MFSLYLILFLKLKTLLMRNRIAISEPDIIKYQRINKSLNLDDASIHLVENNPVFEILAAEGCENFADYIGWLGFAKVSNLIVLSSQRHYYYEEEDLRNMNAVVNLKQLNQIKNLNSLFRCIFKIIPPKSYFIGCFAEYNRHQVLHINNSSSDDGSNTNSDALENGIISKIPFLNMIYNFMDSKTNRYMTRRDVNSLFETHGFKILDMTELNGLTFFLAQKVQVSVE